MKRKQFFTGLVALALTACGKITNTNSDFEIDSGGMKVHVESTPDPIKSFSVIDDTGNLVGYYGGNNGSLQINSVNNKQITMFGANDITIQTGNGDVVLNADDHVTISAATGNININSILGDVIFQSLPTSDPGVAGALWRDGNDSKISTG